MSEDSERIARFDTLRAELRTMNDDQLKARFWQLCEEVMTPVVDLARTHTSPSIERSVLLRMGIDSVTTHAVVDNINLAGLLGKGAGHVVLRLSQRANCDVREAAKEIATNPTVLAGLFEEGAK